MSAVLETTPIQGSALHFAAMGLRCFPLDPVIKKASRKGWQTTATSCPAQLARWFGPGTGHTRFGIATGDQRTCPTTGAAQWLTAVDLDLKNGKNGFLTIAAACKSAGLDFVKEVAETLCQGTPSKGAHAIFWCNVRLKNDADVLGDGSGVDVRARGGLIVGAGSVNVDGGVYTITNDKPIATMSDAFAALFPLDANDTKVADATPIEGIDATGARAQAVEYLKATRGAIEGQKGDRRTLDAAMRVLDYGCSQDDAVQLILEHYNPGCVPEWTADEVVAKVCNAAKTRKDPPGILNTRAAFEPVLNADDALPEASHPLEKLNAEYAFVLIGGNGYVLWETVDEKGNPRMDLLTLLAFQQLHAASQFQSGNSTQPLARTWLEWSGRRTYHRLAFAPGKDLPERFYNMWRGFAVAPAPGKWPLMRALIRDVICSSDAALDAYVMGWLARAMQLPGERGEVALVLKGGKGTGKGTLGHAVRRIFGRHGVHISNADHLVGKFNKHLQEAAFLFADEAFFAGDVKHEGVLKSLITEPTIMIEAKGKDAEARDNCLHVLMASNEEWVIPASADERRFAVIEVSSEHQQDEAYFDAIARELEAGGLEAMLHDLLAYPLAGFSVRKVPQTKALGDQKLVGLRGPARWLYDALQDGAVNQLHVGMEWASKELLLAKSSAYDDYAAKSRRYGEHHPVPNKLFWKVIRQAMPGFRETRTGASQIRHAIFPPLHEARDAFADYMRMRITWDDTAGAGIFD